VRTFKEIQADVDNALGVFDATALLQFVDELVALGTPDSDALTQLSHGVVEVAHGNYSEALEYMHRAMDMYTELADRAGAARAIGGIGVVHNHKGNYPEATEHYHRALDVHTELDDRAGMMRDTANIGSMHFKSGNYPEALEHLHRALELSNALGNREASARIILSIGGIHGQTGNYSEAIEHIHKALGMHEELGDRNGMGGALHSIGSEQKSLGNLPDALEYYHRALDIFEETGYANGIEASKFGIANTLMEAGQYSEVEAILGEFDSKHYEDPSRLIAREMIRAKIQEHNGRLDAAVTTLEAALHVANQHALPSSQAGVHRRIRDIALKQNDLASYVEHNNEFTRITELIQGKEATQRMSVMNSERKMEAERRERDKERALLFGTLPESVATRILRGEKVTGDHYENASVIFVDIVGFTSISDKIPPGHVVHLLSQIFSALDVVCKAHGVTKIKTIGDSYMAAAGVPDAQDDSTIRAAACALELLSTLGALQITMPPELGDTSWTKDVDDIQVRIGLHCGPVTAGVIGTERLQYDVWGDTVNVASRMESTGEAGRIQCSEAFAQLLLAVAVAESDGTANSNSQQQQPAANSNSQQQPKLTERGEVSVKGKGTMTTYWLESTI
jgi:adenylate cyclase